MGSAKVRKIRSRQAERNARGLLARPFTGNSESEPYRALSRPELLLEVRVTRNLLAALLAQIDVERQDTERERARETAARDVLAQALALARPIEGARRRIEIDEGSELWSIIAKLVATGREQLEFTFPPAKTPSARVVETPERKRWWESG